MKNHLSNDWILIWAIEIIKTNFKHHQYEKVMKIQNKVKINKKSQRCGKINFIKWSHCLSNLKDKYK